MVEMLGVLAIIGVLSVGGISGYSKAMAKFKLTKAQDQMSMLLMNVRTAFATSSSYEGLNNGTAVTFGIAPADMTTVKKSVATGSSTPLTNAFGGPAHVGSCDVTTLDCATVTNILPIQLFGIRFEGLSRDACFALGGIDWGADGLIEIKINDKEHTTADFPIPLTTIANDCNSYADNSITWTYY